MSWDALDAQYTCPTGTDWQQRDGGFELINLYSDAVLCSILPANVFLNGKRPDWWWLRINEIGYEGAGDQVEVQLCRSRLEALSLGNRAVWEAWIK